MLSLILALFSAPAMADSASIEWPSRNSKVVCGGMVDQTSLKMSVVTADLLKGESDSGRALVFISLSKPGRVRFVLANGLTDAEYEKREAILEKLPKEDAALMRKLTMSHQSDIYMGLTEGFVHYETASGERSLSLSCREDARPPTAQR